MIKRVIEQIFQAHAADSLRKTLADVERAASGKLHNESLADYVTRLASFKYDAEHRIEQLADYAALTDEWHTVSLENGREPDELMGDYMVRIWTALDVAQRFAEDQKEKLEKAQKEWQERDAAQSKSFNRRLDELAEEAIKQKFRADDIQRELAKSISVANERAQEISKLRGTHADDIARIDKLSAQLAEIESEATEYGRDEGESVPKFMSRLVNDLGDERASSMAMAKALAEGKEDVAREHERGNRINSEYEASISNIMAAASKLGRADYEAPDAFMQRQASEIARLRSRVSEEINDAYKCAGTLGRLSTETVTDFMKRQHAEIEKEQQRNVQMGERLSLVMQDYQDKSQQLLKVQGCHEENLQKIKSLEGDCARLQSSIKEACEIAKANGRTESESLGWFVDRICAESKRKDQTVARLQKVLTKIHDAAKSGGLKQGEKIGAFIERMNEDLYKVRSDAASESMKMGNANKRMQQAYDEADEERKVSKRFHALAVEERNNAQEEVSRLSSELDITTKRLQAGEFTWNTYGQLCNFATSCGMTGDESVKQFIERKIIEASTVTADRDRIRAELAAILAEANKSGRCNGDPVQLLKAGQNDLDALTHFEKDNAKLDSLVSKLQGELAEARDQAGTAQHECSIWNNAALRAGQTLSKLGKLHDENEAQFIERMQNAEFTREEQLKNALAAKNKAQSEYDESHRRFMNLIRMADSCGRLRGESVEQFVARQDQLRVSNIEQRDEARSEVERLSALVAELQVELDDARGKYGGIMAQLGSETPLQLIERMQRLAQDQRASTIPHDERAMLVAESADLRKRLEASQKAHAKTEHELRGKLRAALATVENQSAAIAEAKQATDKYTAVVEEAAKLKDWASTIRHKVLVAMVHTKAMAEYDTIMKELDGGKVPQ